MRGPLLTALRTFNEPRLSGSTRRMREGAGPGLDSTPPSSSSRATSMDDDERRGAGRKKPFRPTRAARLERRNDIRPAHGKTSEGRVQVQVPAAEAVCGNCRSPDESTLQCSARTTKHNTKRIIVHVVRRRDSEYKSRSTFNDVGYSAAAMGVA